MKFALVIHAAPEAHEGSRSALLFARAALAAGHEIYRVFFYGEGVYTATHLHVTPQGEDDVRAAWRELVAQHSLDAVVCIAAGLKRGIIDEAEAKRYQRDASSLGVPFVLSGLGQLLEAAVQADRVVTFGA